MSGTLGRRLWDAVQLFRPRTLARLAKTDDRLQQQIHALSAEVQTLKAQLSLVARKEHQLRTIVETQYGSNDQLTRFEAIVRESPIAKHVSGAIATAPMRHDPFPHCVVDDLLPAEYYDALIAALPPTELFTDRSEHRQQLTVPFEFGPQYSMEVWRHMTRVVAEGLIKPAVLAKFHEPLTNWLRETLPVLGEQPLDQLHINYSDGRILLSGPGDRTCPHRDPKWGFITCLVYLAREGDDESEETQLFSVEKDEEAVGAGTHWISEARCQLVSEVAFRPNRALVFLNSAGAHGAHLSPDAKPARLGRYAYQFRIGAAHRSIKSIRAQLTPKQRAFWAGKADDEVAAALGLESGTFTSR